MLQPHTAKMADLACLWAAEPRQPASQDEYGILKLEHSAGAGYSSPHAPPGRPTRFCLVHRPPRPNPLPFRLNCFIGFFGASPGQSSCVFACPPANAYLLPYSCRPCSASWPCAWRPLRRRLATATMAVTAV